MVAVVCGADSPSGQNKVGARTVLELAAHLSESRDLGFEDAKGRLVWQTEMEVVGGDE